MKLDGYRIICEANWKNDIRYLSTKRLKYLIARGRFLLKKRSKLISSDPTKAEKILDQLIDIQQEIPRVAKFVPRKIKAHLLSKM